MTKIVFLFSFLTASLYGTYCMAQRDGLMLEVRTPNEIVIHHILEQGQTLYGISKTFGVDINDLILMNPERRVDSLKIGQDIRVPIDKDRICYSSDQCRLKKKIPVYYTIQAKDNLFRIARIYFNSTIEQIKSLNEMEDGVLSPGNTLQIGWIAYTDYLDSYLSREQIIAISQTVPQEAEIKEKPEPAVFSGPEPVLMTMKEDQPEEVNLILESIEKKDTGTDLWSFEKESEKSKDIHVFNPNRKKLVTKGATAYWNKNSSSKKGFYLLHKTLPVHSLVQVTNPVTNETVLARVVGQIPDNIYAPEISLVITSEVAKALGVIDKKFYVKITYPEE